MCCLISSGSRFVCQRLCGCITFASVKSVVEDIMSTTKESGTSVYIDDTWDEKVGGYTGRELDISDDVAATMGYVEGTYESMNGSWKGSGTCTYIDKDGDRLYESWEEDSNKGTYKTTGGTGKYK